MPGHRGCGEVGLAASRRFLAGAPAEDGLPADAVGLRGGSQAGVVGATAAALELLARYRPIWMHVVSAVLGLVEH